jgi:hypothetical protein
VIVNSTITEFIFRSLPSIDDQVGFIDEWFVMKSTQEKWRVFEEVLGRPPYSMTSIYCCLKED